MSDRQLLHSLASSIHAFSRKQSAWTRAGLVAVAAVTVYAVGHDGLSYLTTAKRLVSEKVQGNIPISFELERARTMVTSLIPDLRRNMYVIAQEKSVIEELRREIATTETSVGKEREALLTLRNDADNKTGSFRVGARPANSGEVREELTRRFARYQTLEATLDARRQMLTARESSLASAELKLKNMLNTKNDLEVQIQQLVAKLQAQEAQAASSSVAIDDTQLSRCKQLVDDVRIRLDVADKLAVVAGSNSFDDSSFPPLLSRGDVTDQIDTYFARFEHAKDQGSIAE